MIKMEATKLLRYGSMIWLIINLFYVITPHYFTIYMIMMSLYYIAESKWKQLGFFLLVMGSIRLAMMYINEYIVILVLFIAMFTYIYKQTNGLKDLDANEMMAEAKRRTAKIQLNTIKKLDPEGKTDPAFIKELEEVAYGKKRQD